MKVRPGARGDPVRLRQGQSDKSEWNRGVYAPPLEFVQEAGLFVRYFAQTRALLTRG